jgi:hypothetical protein
LGFSRTFRLIFIFSDDLAIRIQIGVISLKLSLGKIVEGVDAAHRIADRDQTAVPHAVKTDVVLFQTVKIYLGFLL